MNVVLTLSAPFAQAPRIGLVVPIIQWFDTLLSLSRADFCRISNFKECRCHFYEPPGIYGNDFAHILFLGHHDFVVDYPLGLILEKCAARVYVDRLILHQCPVISLGILPSCMEEETSSYGFSDLRKFLPSTDNF